jgi:hypothetical protein
MGRTCPLPAVRRAGGGAKNSSRVGEFSVSSAMLISWSGRPELSIVRGNRKEEKSEPMKAVNWAIVSRGKIKAFLVVFRSSFFAQSDQRRR